MNNLLRNSASAADILTDIYLIFLSSSKASAKSVLWNMQFGSCSFVIFRDLLNNIYSWFGIAK
jgi:hypothetical protein